MNIQTKPTAAAPHIKAQIHTLRHAGDNRHQASHAACTKKSVGMDCVEPEKGVLLVREKAPQGRAKPKHGKPYWVLEVRETPDIAIGQEMLNHWGFEAPSQAAVDEAFAEDQRQQGRNTASRACRSRSSATVPTRSISRTRTPTGGKWNTARPKSSTTRSARRAISTSSPPDNKGEKNNVSRYTTVSRRISSRMAPSNAPIWPRPPFLVDFLGLDIIRPLGRKRNICGRAVRGRSSASNIQDGDPEEQGRESFQAHRCQRTPKWIAAHDAALRLKDDYGIETGAGPREFRRSSLPSGCSTLNNTWWEITTVAQRDLRHAVRA